MMLIDQLIEEIKELQKYKEKYEYAQRDKKVMSQKLFEYMQIEYKQKDYDKRCTEYIKTTCSCCRYKDKCVLMGNLPENICEPVPSDEGWIPGIKICENFRWS